MKSLAVKATFKILLAPKWMGNKEGQAFSEDTVADLNTVWSRSPKAKIFPAPTSSILSKF